jgi:hypothetical protein
MDEEQDNEMKDKCLEKRNEEGIWTKSIRGKDAV